MGRGGLYQIGEVAERLGLSLRTVRYYEEVGLVAPAERSPGGFRLYDDDAIDRLALIKQMKPLEFSLEETRELLELRERLGDAALPAGERAGLVERLAMFTQPSVVMTSEPWRSVSSPLAPSSVRNPTRKGRPGRASAADPDIPLARDAGPPTGSLYSLVT